MEPIKASVRIKKMDMGYRIMSDAIDKLLADADKIWGSGLEYGE